MRDQAKPHFQLSEPLKPMEKLGEEKLIPGGKDFAKPNRAYETGFVLPEEKDVPTDGFRQEITVYSEELRRLGKEFKEVVEGIRETIQLLEGPIERMKETGKLPTPQETDEMAANRNTLEELKFNAKNLQEEINSLKMGIASAFDMMSAPEEEMRN